MAAADGGLWVPMHGTGLGYLPADWKRTAVLKPAAPMGDAIYCNLAPAKRSGGLWQVDAQGRLLRVDPSTGEAFQTGLQSPQLKGMELVSALEDGLQRVWLGNLSFGLSRMDLRTGEFIHWPSDGPEPASALSAPEWITEHGDTVWMAFIDMVQQRDLRTGKVLQRITQQDLHGLRAIDIQQLEQGPDGRVWVAGEGGMFAWTMRQAASCRCQVWQERKSRHLPARLRRQSGCIGPPVQSNGKRLQTAGSGCARSARRMG